MNSHPPGPWTLNPEYRDEIEACGGKRRIGEVCGGRFVGDCSDPQYEIPAEVLANARLVAAAPELLEALDGLAQIADDIINCDISEERMSQLKVDYEIALRVLLKARGEAGLAECPTCHSDDPAIVPMGCGDPWHKNPGGAE